MIPIEPRQVTPALETLFDRDMPSTIRCFAVLGGGNAGKIFTDDIDHPTIGLVWEADDGTLYHGGTLDLQILQRMVDSLRQEGTVALAFREGSPDVNHFPPNPDAHAACLEFDRPISSSDLSPLMERLPKGYEIHRMDRILLERSPSRDAKIIRYGSIDNLLDKGIAVCILHGEEIVCEAYADMKIMGVRELGVTTQKAYLGQGFATITCAHLIQICEETGCRQTYWDCAKHNPASAALARKLGFRNEREYQMVAWFRPKK